MKTKIKLSLALSALGLAGALGAGHAAALDNDNCDRESGNICFEAIDGHEFWFNPGTQFTTDKGTLTAQKNGSLVLTDENGTVRWQTNTKRPGAATVWQEDGNLVTYLNDKPLWASNTGGIGAYLVLQTDGNLVIYNRSDKPIWATDTGH